MITVTLDMPAAMGALQRARREVQFASVVALTRSANAAAADLSRETERVFDRPTAWTVKAFYTRAATMARPIAEVGIKDQAPKGTPAAKYLQAQIEGGTRRPKRGERAIERAGLLPPGFLVPAAGIRLDAYGNVPGPTMVRIISDLKASGEQGFAANRTVRSTARNKRNRAERFFVARRDDPRTRHLAPGIWLRRNGGILPALIWVSSVSYRKRFDFYGLARRAVAEHYPAEFRRAMAGTSSRMAA